MIPGARGYEIVGGPMDGDVIAIPPDAHYWRVYMPMIAPWPVGSESDEVVPALTPRTGLYVVRPMGDGLVLLWAGED